MVKFTENGITDYKGLQGHVVDVNQAWRTGFGDLVNTSSESGQGQFSYGVAIALTDDEESVISTYKETDIRTASGVFLDNILKIFGVFRIEGTKTQVTCQLTGAAKTYIAAGTKAKADNGDIYKLLNAVILDDTGKIETVLENENIGRLECGVGQLNSIVDVVVGWETITNAESGITGTNRESDAVFRVAGLERNAIGGAGDIKAIESAILNVKGVSACKAFDNSGDIPFTKQNVTIPPSTVYVVVVGGTVEDVVMAMLHSRSGGSGTYGAESYQPVEEGQLLPFHFDYAKPVTATIDVSIQASEFYQPSIEALIKTAVVDMISSRAKIGQSLYYDDIQAVIKPLGVRILSITINGAGFLDVDLNQIVTTTATDVNVLEVTR